MTHEVRGVFLDAHEPRAVQPVRQGNAADQICFAWVATGKSHACLKDDASLLWNGPQGTTRLCHPLKLLEELVNEWLTAGKKRLETKLAA